MKHLLNNLTEEEKNRIRGQHKDSINVMTENFSRLINSKSGEIKPLVSEQEEPTTTTTTTTTPTPTVTPSNDQTKMTTNDDPTRQIRRDMLKIVEKRTPISDDRVRKSINSALSIITGHGIYKDNSFDDRCKRYDSHIEKNGLSSYLPSSEWFVKAREIK